MLVGDRVETRGDVVVGEAGHAVAADEAAMATEIGDIEFHVGWQLELLEGIDRNHRIIACGEDGGGYLHRQHGVAGHRIAVQILLQRLEVGMPQHHRLGDQFAF